jgi:hypothetical protein
MDPKTLIPTYLGLAVGFVFLPVIVTTAFDARRKRLVTCPETGLKAAISLGPRREILRLFADAKPCVGACSRWPERAGCLQACVG